MDQIVVAIETTNGCIRLFDAETVDGHEIVTGPPFFELFPAGFSREALMACFYYEDAMVIYEAYTGRETIEDDAAAAGAPKRKTVTPVRRWLQITRSDGCQLLAKDFPLVGAGPYRAIAIWANGVSLYRRSIGKRNPPRDADRFDHLGPAAIDAGGLMAYLEPRDAAEVEAAYKLNRRWLFRLVNGGNRADTGT